MKVLDAHAHAYVDWGLVLAYALGPSLLGFAGTPAAVCYLLAFAQCAFTVATTHRAMTRLGRIPHLVHRKLEVALAIGLLVAPWLLGVAARPRNYFLGVGAVVAASVATTDYRREDDSDDELPRSSII